MGDCVSLYTGEYSTGIQIVLKYIGHYFAVFQEIHYKLN